MTDSAKAGRGRRLKEAVRRNRTFSRAGLAELMFTWAFKGLVYPQIWEDPEIDLEALALTPECHLVTIASGGCNVLSYLMRRSQANHCGRPQPRPRRTQPAEACRGSAAAVLGRLLPLLRRRRSTAPISTPIGAISPRISMPTRAPIGSAAASSASAASASPCSRAICIAMACSGTSIGLAHLIARALRHRSSQAAAARSLEEQRLMYESSLEPLFEKRFVRWATAQQLSLYGLGIPPAQYGALAPAGDMANVLRDRVERLACGFSFNDNYFAWQAFGRAYPDRGKRRSAAALSAARQLRRHPRPRRPRRGAQPLVHRISCDPPRPVGSTAMCCSMRRTG